MEHSFPSFFAVGEKVTKIWNKPIDGPVRQNSHQISEIFGRRKKIRILHQLDQSREQKTTKLYDVHFDRNSMKFLAIFRLHN